MNAADGGFAPPGACRLPAARWRAGRIEGGTELVADEVPVALVYGGISHAVMLASPQDLEDFAVGFSLSEGIVPDLRAIYDIEVEEEARGIVVALRIASGAMMRLKETRRARTGRTGCGLCGVESLARFGEELGAPPVPAARAAPIAPDALHRAMAAMAARQDLHHATGAVHAAGWADRDGALLCVREDVGRHNALDKLVGALARGGYDPGAGFAVVTSRASYEMVQKAARARMPLLAAISAPTALAVQLAQDSGLTLAGFVRDGRHILYTHPQRLAPDGV
ncbi:formate dehydrogenase accessory sulfurtransferase FdhD [Massilia oculi]|uniref:Sulfur carrier protein FdhD n=1 Tax=Massilia hydrophila TaxID=3044279 RepID=A0ABS7Y7E7_9BURK|nr:formate dehydrogenase accessory sulfurtransferase FdhD [Massilia oculi]MCA1855027.1 formate dehydrogenase accessory sulfurtransferase FdhD [Massilia oculi]